MIHLAYGNRLEDLGTLLSQDLARRDDPLAPVRLVLGGGGVLAWWVRLALARTQGIAAHILTQSLPGYVAERAAETGVGILIDRLRFETALLGFLATPQRLAGAVYAPLAGFLDAAGTGEAARDRRRARMAAELASLFYTYGLERPREMARWLAEPEGAAPESDAGARRPPREALAPVEVALGRVGHTPWQRRLFFELFARGGSFATDARDAATGLRFLSWPTLCSGGTRFGTQTEASERDNLLGRLVPSEPLHVFAPSALTESEELALTAFAARGDLYVYALNPCREFWEDAPRRKSRGKVSRQLDLPLGAPTAVARPPQRSDAPAPSPAADEEPLALTSWGTEARRRVRFFNQLSEGDFRETFRAPSAAENGTRLGALQASLLARAPTAGGPPSRFAADESLVIVGAPSPRRACEAIAAEIWRRVTAAPGDTPLLFKDIAVVATGPKTDTWLAALAACFGEARSLPFCLVERPLRAESPFVEAVDLLLTLPTKRVARRELIEAFGHPNLRLRLGMNDASDLTALAVHLGVVREADAAGSARDPVTWDEGLARLAFGRVLDAGASETAETPSTQGPRVDRRVVPVTVGPAWQERADAWASTVRALLSDVEAVRAVTLPLATWADVFRRLIDAYVAVADKGDEPARLRVYDLLATLGRISPEAPVGYQAAREVFHAALDRLTTARGTALVHGVTLAPWAAMRAVPYRLIFVVGLDEGAFPAPGRPHHLDVRADEELARVLGPRDRDRGLFLDTLLAARDALVLVYQDRDEKTGERLRPSVIVDELEDVTTAAGLTDGAGLPRREVPLWRHEDPLTAAAFPVAEAERQASANARLLSATAGSAAPEPRDIAGDEDALRGARRPAIEPVVGVAGVRRLRVTQLRDFLRCPLQGSAKAALGLETPDDESEEALRQDELLDPARLAQRVLLHQAFWRALWREGEAARTPSGQPFPSREELGAAYDETLASLEDTGQYPGGLFASARRGPDLAKLTAWAQSLGQISPAIRRPLPALRLGRGMPEERTASAPAFRLAVSAGSIDAVEIHGSFPPRVLLQDDGGAALEAALIPLVRSLKRSQFPPAKDARLAEALLSHMIAAAAADADSARACAATPAQALVLLSPDPEEAPTLARFKKVATEDARAYLRSLAEDLLTPSPAYLFPYDAVLKWRPLVARSRRGRVTPVDGLAAEPSREEIGVALAGEMETLFRDSYYRGRLTSQHGPVRAWSEAPLVTAPEAARLWERRFAPLWALLEDVS